MLWKNMFGLKYAKASSIMSGPSAQERVRSLNPAPVRTTTHHATNRACTEVKVTALLEQKYQTCPWFEQENDAICL